MKMTEEEARLFDTIAHSMAIKYFDVNGTPSTDIGMLAGNVAKAVIKERRAFEAEDDGGDNQKSALNDKVSETPPEPYRTYDFK